MILTKQINGTERKIRVRNRRIRRSLIKEGTKCFYTGMSVVIEPERYNTGTIEHLIPQSRVARHQVDSFENCVIASHLANTCVGSAPLVVKNQLRDYFLNSNICIMPGMDENSTKNTYKKLIRSFLRPYSHFENKLYIWDFKGTPDMELRRELFSRYVSLLSEVEKNMFEDWLKDQTRQFL